MNKQRKVKEKYTPGSKVLTVFFIALCLVWVIPVIEVLINSFKSNNYVNLEPFALPTEESFVGLANYIKGSASSSRSSPWRSSCCSAR